MLHGEFSRRSTPTHIFTLPDELTMKDIVDVSIAYRQKNNTVLIKHLEDCHFFPQLDPEKTVAVVLSQEETLLFNPNIKIVEVQFTVATTGSDVIPISEYRFRLKDSFDQGVFDLS